MRLLNTNTLELEWFVDENCPSYIILSHRWEGSETSLQQFKEQRHEDKSQWSHGTAKVLRLCELARKSGAGYVWIDTCCIDKTSSAELQEAINSMYKWYERAEICFVYLDDVHVDAGDAGLRASRWFTRGWTLQEMLAPKASNFYDADWNLIGSRSDLAAILSDITTISAKYFGNTDAIRSANIAERMSWASKRTTTRIEDIAYCLLGIFDVNMTMLYGEGEKAFLRLQHEIIQNIEDETIFAWAAPANLQTKAAGLLAVHPICFAGTPELGLKHDEYFARDPYRMTNRGLEIEIYDRIVKKFGDTVPLLLNVLSGDMRVAIALHKKGPHHWVRANPCKCETKGRPTYIPKSEESLYYDQKNKAFRKRMTSHLEGKNGDSSLEDFRDRLDNEGGSRFKVYVR